MGARTSSGRLCGFERSACSARQRQHIGRHPSPAARWWIHA